MCGQFFMVDPFPVRTVWETIPTFYLIPNGRLGNDSYIQNVFNPTAIPLFVSVITNRGSLMSLVTVLGILTFPFLRLN
ncbi:MAG: hypothetical protein V3V48_05825 [Candidatus Aminicenantaceae bacterium]|jgi:hypothetical protein